MMFYFKNEKELTEILKSFNAPKLIYKGKLDAGPDEELYFFEDEDENKYGLWSRDYMDKLEYEANGLKNSFDIDVVEWIATVSETDRIRYDGYSFALFKMRRL